MTEPCSRWLNWVVAGLLVATSAVALCAATPFPADDHFLYQAFINALASGSLDLSIHGFHGSDFLATFWHLVSGSETSQIQFQIGCAVALPVCALLAAKALYERRLDQILFMLTISMMPFIGFVALRGWTGPAYMCLMLLSIAAARKLPVLAGVLLALAILTKPFAVALLPLLWVLSAKNKRLLGLALGLPALYVLAQYLQVGAVLVGSHADLSATSVWQGPMRIALNAAHTLQILFSVHNYFPFDASLTGPGNLMHTTPILIFMGLFALLQPGIINSLAFRRALAVGIVVGLGLNLLLDHMDHFYMQAGVLCFIIAAIPALRKYPLWWPLVFATLHFQWLYFYLEYREPFALTETFFVVPVVVDLILLGLLIMHQKQVCATVKATWTAA